MNLQLRTGCASWNIPKEYAGEFPGEGTHLERYARRFYAVEINTSFYRPHKPETYARWAAVTPEGFQFALKVPREITHEQRLRAWSGLDRFLDETGALGKKLGLWLLQLPPSLRFDALTVERFLSALRGRFDGHVACEPRHVSWFTAEAGQLLAAFRVARVAADPAVSHQGTKPGGWGGLIYYRLHGSPRMYFSPYSDDFLITFAATLSDLAKSVPVWCIFNNTAQGAATQNALSLIAKL